MADSAVRDPASGAGAVAVDAPPDGASQVEALEEALERQAARFDAFMDVSRALTSTLNTDALLQLIMDRATKLLDSDRSTLFLMDEAKGELWSMIAQGATMKEIRVPVDKGLVGWVARTGALLNLPDAYQDSRFNPEVDRVSGYRTRSVLCMPLRDKTGKVIGVIQTLNKRTGPFTADDVRLLGALCSQATVALENARLYADAVGKNAELRQAQILLRHKIAAVDLVYDLERDITTAPDLVNGLDWILAKAMAVIGADAGCILLAEKEPGELFFKSALGGQAEVVKRMSIPLGKGIAGTVAVTGEPIISNRAQQERAYDPTVVERTGYPFESCLCAPIGTPGHWIGAIEVLNKKTGDFDGDDLRLLMLVAGQMARFVSIFRQREAEVREQRMAAIGQLLSGVLHDFRTPMSIISGYAQLMAGETDPEERKKASQLILKQFDTINAMTREVLDFAKGKVEILLRKVHVNTFVDEVTEYLRKDFNGRGVDLVVRADYDGPARFDENKMKRVIYNIARNAAQAMPSGGVFTLHVTKSGDQLVWRMSDTGQGIPMEIRDRLFQSFASHGKEEGTGLGLAIVKRIAEQHGGSVHYETETGRGTTFVVRIPL
jgi:K+-sensing histidine kinase KdpD